MFVTSISVLYLNVCKTAAATAQRELVVAFGRLTTKEIGTECTTDVTGIII